LFELRTKEHIELFFNNDNDDDVSSDNNVLRSKIKDFETKINVINHNESHIRMLMDDTGNTTPTTTTTTTKSIAMIYDQKFRYTESNNTSLIALSKIVTAPFSTIELRAQYTETLKNDTLLDNNNTSNNNTNAFANLASVQPLKFESVEEEVADDDDDDDDSNDKWPFLRNGFFMAITIAIVMLLIVVGLLSRGYRFRDGSCSRYNAEDFVTPPVANPNPDLVRRNPAGVMRPLRINKTQSFSPKNSPKKVGSPHFDRTFSYETTQSGHSPSFQRGRKSPRSTNSLARNSPSPASQQIKTVDSWRDEPLQKNLKPKEYKKSHGNDSIFRDQANLV